MPSAISLLAMGFAAFAMAACHKQQPKAADNQDMSIEANVAEEEIPANAEIETLPPDESSETSSGELAKGDDNPDVNDLNATANSH